MPTLNDTTPPEKLTNELKQVAAELMMNAWKAFDQALEDKKQQHYIKAIGSICNAIDNGIRSLTILYTGNPDAEKETGLLNHLIISKHPCFSLCRKDILARYDDWRNNYKKTPSGHKLSAVVSLYIKDAETVLKSIESYNFYIKRQVYAVKEDDDVLSGKKILLLGIGLFFLFFGILYPVYRYIDPVMDYEADGQIFWQTDAGIPESEHNSIRFKVFGDGKFHNYSINTVSPTAQLIGTDAIGLVSLRFDPIREQGALIWIDSIALFASDTQQPIIYEFEDDADGWTAVNNIEKVEIQDGCLFFNTTGHDPYIKKPDLNLKLFRIKIRMKVVIYKSFFQWIFS